MVFGYLLIAIALLATVAGSVLFTRAWRANQEQFVRAGRVAAVTAALGVAGASAFLIYLFSTHQFQVGYVAEYSALRSKARFLLAAFWGGQEGSILLWTLWTALLGAILAFRGGERTAKVWPVFGVVQCFLLSLLLLKSPFALGEGPVPPDGRGLNPLLENPWMVIHPPILFLGFSALLIPFCWAVYGLLHRDWDGWVRQAFSWALFGFSILGFGVALGGYWAYETLGWGGFWAWDPVENTSLVPWLMVTALLHGIPIQRANGGFKVTNFLLGTLPFAFMFYGTFLTRTGVLEGFSVHTFSSLGHDGFVLLLIGVCATAFLPIALLLWRWKTIPKPQAYAKVFTREFGYFLASAILGLLGIITAVGMSAPLLTRLWLEKGASAGQSFYNQAAYPLVLLMAVGMAATPYFAWRATPMEPVWKRLGPAYIGAVVLTFGFLFLGGRNTWMLLLFLTGTFAALTNLILLVPRLPRREKRRTVGGFVAHMGIGISLAGIAALIAFGSKPQQVTLIQNVPTEALGYRLTYLGMSSQPYDRDHNMLRVQVEKKGESFEANPRFYFAPWGGKDTLFANPPAIHRYVWGDLYLAFDGGPVANVAGDTPHPTNRLELTDVREPHRFGDYTLLFRGMDFPDYVRNTAKAGGPEALAKLPEVTIQAVVDVSYKGVVKTLRPELKIQKRGGVFSTPILLPSDDPNRKPILLLEQPEMDQGKQTMYLRTFNLGDVPEVIGLEISTKPMIWMVWLGPLLYTLGGLIAYRRRASEMRE